MDKRNVKWEMKKDFRIYDNSFYYSSFRFRIFGNSAFGILFIWYLARNTFLHPNQNILIDDKKRSIILH